MSETGGSLDFYFVAFFYGFFVYSNNLIKICNRYSLLLITFFFQTLTFQIDSAQSGLPIQPLKTLDLVKPNFESRYPSYQGTRGPLLTLFLKTLEKQLCERRVI